MKRTFPTQPSHSPRPVERIVPDFTVALEQREFVEALLCRLTSDRQIVVVAWMNGEMAGLAARLGISERAVYKRLRAGVSDLRELAGVCE